MVRGRPAVMAPRQVRDLIVTFRVNQAEYRQLQALAMRRGQSIGKVLRELVAQAEGLTPKG